jgi:hypothetical protein
VALWQSARPNAATLPPAPEHDKRLKSSRPKATKDTVTAPPLCILCIFIGVTKAKRGRATAHPGRAERAVGCAGRAQSIALRAMPVQRLGGRRCCHTVWQDISYFARGQLPTGRTSAYGQRHSAA